MRASLLLAFALCACSDEPEPRGPVESLKPGGTGWECFSARDSDFSLCERPGNCESRRAAFITESERDGAFFDLTECVARTRAVCFTAQFVTIRRSGYVCAESMTDCLAMQRAATQSVEYRDVSGCGTW